MVIAPIHEFIEGIGYDALIEAISMIIAALVCITAYKVYQITKERSSQLLSLGFLMLTIAYAVVAAGNLTLYLQGTIFVREEFFFIVHFAYLVAKTLGLLTLACIPLRIGDTRVYGLIAFLVIISIYANSEHMIIYQIMSLILYAVLIAAYVKAYSHRRNKNTLLLAIGFILLAVAAVDYIFLDAGFSVYILGHIIEFAGYAFILAALLFAYTFQHETRKAPDHS